MKQKLASLNPDEEGSSQEFRLRVDAIRDVLRHTYRAIAFAAKRSGDSTESIKLWSCFIQTADVALELLKEAKGKFPNCGSPELYDLALDYRLAASERLHQNREDEACGKIPAPKGLFPSVS